MKSNFCSTIAHFVEWIGRGELLNFEEHDYAYHLDSLVRCYGIEAAQKYIERVPKSFRNGVLYETLLLVVCIWLMSRRHTKSSRR
ncbi:hypothetical protein EJB05_13430, partial [Eragrostis curvula]